MLIDTHAHLYWEYFKDDLDQVIQRSIDAKVNTIINVGVDVELSEKAARQLGNLRQIPGLTTYSTIGIHPHEAVKYDSDESIHRDIDKLRHIYQSGAGKVVAVGECGLDFFFDPQFTTTSLSQSEIKQLQRQLFQAQIDLSQKLNLPLLVHCRDDRSQNPQNSEGWDEALEMIDKHPAILHCYSGLPPITSYILHTPNLLVSFAANITYPKNQYLRQAAKTLPISKICLETDSPFLAPQSKRGQRNEPANVLEIARLLADIKGLSLEQVESQTTQNVKTFLKLS